jgi:hypothetical protein
LGDLAKKHHNQRQLYPEEDSDTCLTGFFGFGGKAKLLFVRRGVNGTLVLCAEMVQKVKQGWQVSSPALTCTPRLTGGWPAE